MIESDIYYILTMVLNSISILSCFFIIFIFFMVREIYSFFLELVMYLIVSVSFFNATYYLPGNIDNPIMCQIQGGASFFFDLSGLFWAIIIAQMSYSSITHHEYIEHNKPKLRLLFFSITILIPLAFSLCAYFLETIDVSTEIDESYCWLDFTHSDDTKHTNTMILGIVYLGICWGGIIYGSICIIALIVKICKLDILKEDKKKLIWTLSKYPVVLIINYLPATTVSLIELIRHDSNLPVWCKYTELVLDALSGFFYAIAFGYNQNILYAIKIVFCCEDKTIIEDNSDVLNKTTRTNNFELEKLNGYYLDSYQPADTINSFEE